MDHFLSFHKSKTVKAARRGAGEGPSPTRRASWRGCARCRACWIAAPPRAPASWPPGRRAPARAGARRGSPPPGTRDASRPMYVRLSRSESDSSVPAHHGVRYVGVFTSRLKLKLTWGSFSQFSHIGAAIFGSHLGKVVIGRDPFDSSVACWFLISSQRFVASRWNCKV